MCMCGSVCVVLIIIIMFAFVSAFPKSLHCTDEAQQAETVLSAVLSIIIIIIIIQKERLHNAVYKITKDVCHNLWLPQTALIHYTRGPAQ